MDDNSRFYFVLVAVSAAVAIGSRWLFPFYSFNFGAAFFIAYLVALLVFGMPLLLLEFAIGQHFKKNIVDIFFSVRKWTGMIGWLALINAFILLCIYVGRLSWNIIYLFVSFGLQWKGRAKEYFYQNVLQISTNDYASFSLAIFIALVIAWVLVYPFIRKGFESIKKSFLIALSMLTFLCIFFLIYTLTLENSLLGIYTMFNFNIADFLNLNTWIAAFSLAITSLGISFGIMPAISQKSEGFIARSASITIIFEFLAGILLGFVFLGMLGMLTSKSQVSLGTLVASDYASTFTILSESLVFLHKPTLLSILFFIMLCLFLIIGAASLAYGIINALTRKLNTQNRNIAILIVGFGFLFGLLFAIKPGFYIMDLINHYLYYNILIVVLLEVLAIGWLYRIDKLKNYIDSVSAIKLGAIWAIIVKYLAPVVVLLLIYLQIRKDWIGYKNYAWWSLMVFGIGTIVVPAVIAFLLPEKILDKRKK